MTRDPLTTARDNLRHRWSELRVTGHGFAWACPDCDSVVQGMPPDREALCKGRMLDEIDRQAEQIERLTRAAVDVIRVATSEAHGWDAVADAIGPLALALTPNALAEVAEENGE